MIGADNHFPFGFYGVMFLPSRAVVTFDETMFSEQNGTIIGFSVIVKQVRREWPTLSVFFTMIR